jgi:hypothetical protein
MFSDTMTKSSGSTVRSAVGLWSLAAVGAVVAGVLAGGRQDLGHSHAGDAPCC